MRQSGLKWVGKNPEKVKENRRNWCKANPQKVRKTARKWRNGNKRFRLSNNISCLIRHSLKNGKDGRRWENLVGYTLNQLIKHLEKLFQPGMTWRNYGDWHIDHKIPVSAFNFTKPEHIDFERCWTLKNLQPLWAKDNMVKSSKVVQSFQPSLGI